MRRTFRLYEEKGKEEEEEEEEKKKECSPKRSFREKPKNYFYELGLEPVLSAPIDSTG